TVRRTLIWLSCLRIEIFLASSLLLVCVTSLPSIQTSPLSRGSRRLMIESRVLLPAPFGPMNDVILPLGMVSEMLSTTVFEPYFLVTLRTSITHETPSATER